MSIQMGIVRSKIPYETVDTEFHGINMNTQHSNGMQMVHTKHFDKMSIRTSTSQPTSSAIGRQIQKAKEYLDSRDTSWA